MPNSAVTAAALALTGALSGEFHAVYSFAVLPSASSTCRFPGRTTPSKRLAGKNFYNDFEGYNVDDDEEEEDEEDDDFLLVDDRDWRNFRKNLLADIADDDTKPTSVSRENEEVLESQSPDLYTEYKQGIWAHETSTPEIGGLIVRLPLEVELQRNFAHSITGKSMRETLQVDDTAKWYEEAQTLIAQSMLEIAQLAGDDGQIDPAALSAEKADLLTLYLDNQESWQEVGLILERDTDLGTASTLVLNRPMAFQLTEHLARLVLHGSAMEATPTHTRKPDIHKFLAAFEMECAVYIGGLDQQEEPAEIIHGIKSLKGAVEIAPGTGIYRGGLAAAVDGVIKGIYQPLEFRFFVGKHLFEDNYLDISMLLGKYQPVACSRALALKQCISLPKPLWHEVLEWVGGTLAQISDLELSKRDDLKFKIVDEDFDSGLDELNRFEDDDEEEDDDEDYYSK